MMRTFRRTRSSFFSTRAWKATTSRTESSCSRVSCRRRRATAHSSSTPSAVGSHRCPRLECIAASGAACSGESSERPLDQLTTAARRRPARLWHSVTGVNDDPAVKVQVEDEPSASEEDAVFEAPAVLRLLWADPQYMPEHLALWSLKHFGPRASSAVERLRGSHP